MRRVVIVLVVVVICAFGAYLLQRSSARARRPSPGPSTVTEPLPDTAQPQPEGEPPVPPKKASVAEEVTAAREAFDGDWLGGRIESREQIETRWGPWAEYRAILWASPPKDKRDEYLARYVDLGCNAGMAYRGNSPQPFYDAGLDAYLENVFRSPFFYLKKRIKRPEAEYPSWREVRKAFEKDRSTRELLHRRPSLNDPVQIAIQEKFIRETSVGPFVNLSRKPLAVDLRDEPSVTQSANPFDFDFSPPALRDFRKWLATRYRTLEELNAEWETGFANFAEVVPLTTDEIRKREYPRLDREGVINLAPWADHREFMDVTFAGVTRRFVDYVHSLLPGSYVGLEGLQMPHAFGGYDYWLLANSMNWMEPYDIRCSREICHSFAPHIPVVSTGFETDRRKLLLRLWYLALMGDRGIIIWPFDGKMNDRLVDRSRQGCPLSPVGLEVSAALRSMRDGTADLLATAEQQFSPIAVYYSQASIRADWMFETRVDKSTWIRRFSSYEAEHNQMARAREALGKLIEDLGYQYRYVSYEQVADGELVKARYKFLIAPRLHAVSREEVNGIAEFVRRGGILLTDIHPGIMNEHCRSAAVGLRASVLGLEEEKRVAWQGSPKETKVVLPIGRSVTLNTFCAIERAAATSPAGRAGDELAFLVYPLGKGKAITTCVDLFFAYEKERRTGNGTGIRDYVMSLIKEARIALPLAVRSARGDRPAGVETHFYRGRGVDIVAVGPNPHFRISEELEDLAGKAGAEGLGRVSIKLPYRAFAYDAGRAGLLGYTDVVEVDVSVARPAVIAMLGYEVTGIACTVALTGRFPGLYVEGSIESQQPTPDWAMHVINVAVEKDGEMYPVGGLLTTEGNFSGTVRLPAGVASGGIKVRVTDVISAKSVAQDVPRTTR